MSEDSQRPFYELDEHAALKSILAATAPETGSNFFHALVTQMTEVLNTTGAWITEYVPEKHRLRAISFVLNGQWAEDYEFEIAGTPCETVVDTQEFVHIEDNIIALYPSDSDIEKNGVVSYMGVPLRDIDGTLIGHMAVVDNRRMPEEPRLHTLFRIFAERAAAELRRVRMERALSQHQQQLMRLVDSAMDAIVLIDESLNVVISNVAAERMFKCSANEIIGHSFTRFIDDDARDALIKIAGQLRTQSCDANHQWIPGGFTAKASDGEVFHAEATFSLSERGGSPLFTLILRNVQDRLDAENQIKTLASEREYLREEVRTLGDYGDLIGESPAMRSVFESIDQVAVADSTVLILGETGAGKELVARAVHSASRRGHKPLIRVNCASMPAALIESEFFGHEKGAFTGATQRREGRFALADEGSIFLDEIGELPLELQAKLLRVLQEGEFEPLGSSETQQVDVRIIAATNRNLEEAVAQGAFREDLFFRLNVFPLHLPPLRDRGEDIVLIAQEFVKKLSSRLGIAEPSLSDHCREQLLSYSWPGNVRELHNVIERALITSPPGTLHLDCGSNAMDGGVSQPRTAESNESDHVYTAEEMVAFERANIERALEQSGGKVSGPRGAAQLLGVKPSTLSSRIKALGISKATTRS